MAPKNFLIDAEPRFYFYVCNGTVLKNMHELQILLGNIDDGTFNCHVNDGKNDFLNWIRDVIKDDSLAKSLEKCRTKEKMLECVRKRINDLSGKKNKASKKKETVNSKKFKPVYATVGKKNIISQLKKSL